MTSPKPDDFPQTRWLPPNPMTSPKPDDFPQTRWLPPNPMTSPKPDDFPQTRWLPPNPMTSPKPDDFPQTRWLPPNPMTSLKPADPDMGPECVVSTHWFHSLEHLDSEPLDLPMCLTKLSECLTSICLWFSHTNARKHIPKCCNDTSSKLSQCHKTSDCFYIRTVQISSE